MKTNFVIKNLSTSQYFAGFAFKATWTPDASKAYDCFSYDKAFRTLDAHTRSGDLPPGVYQIERVYITQGENNKCNP